MKTIGERIKQARAAKGWSGKALAKAVGYKNQSTIGNLENRATGTGGNKVGVIAAKLNVPLEWLMYGPDTDNVPFMESKLQQLPGTPYTTTASETSINTDSPFGLFSVADWMQLSEKKRLEFEGPIAFEIMQLKKRRKA